MKVEREHDIVSCSVLCEAVKCNNVLMLLYVFLDLSTGHFLIEVSKHSDNTCFLVAVILKIIH